MLQLIIFEFTQESTFFYEQKWQEPKLVDEVIVNLGH